MNRVAIVVLAVTASAASLFTSAQSAPHQPSRLRATGKELPSLSTQIAFDRPACSAAVLNNELPTNTRWHFQKASDTPTPWIRAHIHVTDHDVGQWTLVLYDGTGKIRESLSSVDFTDGPLWTSEVTGSSFSVDLVAARRVSVQVCVDMISVKSSQAVLSGKALTSPDGKDRRIFVKNGVPGYAFRSPIAIVWFLEKDGTKTNCSGVAITANDVVTNYHCLSDKGQLRNVDIWFSFEEGQQYIPRKVKSFSVPPNKDLDYSILKVDSPIPDSYVAAVSNRDLSSGDNLMLMQHPEGSEKMIVTNGCVIKATSSPDTIIADSDFSHMCDASGGSSGAPVMDSGGVVVGLHHMEQYDDDTKSYYNMAIKAKTLVNDIGQTEEGKKLVSLIKFVP
jgi:V8-like Glu-specific endopeptidase